MAVSATVQLLELGPRNVIYNLTGLGDGAGQETNVVKVNVANLQAGNATRMRVERISGVVDYGVVELFWDALVPVRFAVLSGPFCLDYNRFGGLPNNAGGGKTGNVLLTTLGFDLNSTYTILLEMVK